MPNEILARLQEGRKPNPNSPKKMIFFVGPPACGKTTKIRVLEKNFGNYYQYITLDGLSPILDNNNKFFRSLNKLLTLSEKIKIAVQTALKTHQNTIFVDGHPILSIFECEAIFRLSNGRDISANQLTIIQEIYKEIVYEINNSKNFRDFQQIIYYINFPFEENLRLLQKKEFCNFITEDIKNELSVFRKVIHSNIFKLSEQFQNLQVIEVNTIISLNIIHMYLLGGSGCC
ncbi:MAG: hypothetical protein ACFFEO_17115 [Candidatus Thorarchaeota archaeon]